MDGHNEPHRRPSDGEGSSRRSGADPMRPSTSSSASSASSSRQSPRRRSGPTSSGRGDSGSLSLGTLPSMAYCHACALAIRPLVSPSQTYTCPRCGGDFVELIEGDDASAAADADADDYRAMPLPTLPSLPPEIGIRRPPPPASAAAAAAAGAGANAPGQAQLPPYDPSASPALNLINALLGGLGGATLGGAATLGRTTGGVGVSIYRPPGAQQGQAPRQQQQQRPAASSATGSGSSAQRSGNGNVRQGSARLGPVNVQWRLNSNLSSPPLQTGGGAAWPNAASAPGWGAGLTANTGASSRAPAAGAASASRGFTLGGGAVPPDSPTAAGFGGLGFGDGGVPMAIGGGDGSAGGSSAGGSSTRASSIYAGQAAASGSSSTSSLPGGRRRASSDTRAASEWRPLAGGPAGVEARGSGIDAADGGVPSLSSFLNAAFGQRPDLTGANAQAARTGTRADAPAYDDGMGGAGAAADGRYFNYDNQRAAAEGQEEPRAAVGGEFAPLMDLFTDFFHGMVGGGGSPGGGGIGAAAAGGGPGGLLFNIFGGGGLLRSNPGDYAWGEQGLDNIITQLMEQAQAAGAGSSAPPPASDEAIARLERFSRKDEARVLKGKNSDCPTCKEDFLPAAGAASDADAEDPPERIAGDVDEGQQQDELVAMPCQHVFHEDCLVPWLKMHGTCPVCRVSLNKQQADAAATGEAYSQAPGGSSGGGTASDDPSARMPGAMPSPPLDETPASPAQMREILRSAAERRAQHGSSLQQDELD